MLRRALLKHAAIASASLAMRPVAQAFPATETPRPFPVIDAHIHLFDPSRPGGVPWPEPGDLIYKPSLPDRFEKIAAGFGVVGAIAIEASPLASDNDWVLALVEKKPVMVGMVGDLIPGTPAYPRQLERLHRSQLFLGIRYGNLWARNLAVDWKSPGFLDGLKSLAQARLVFETANPDPELIQAALDIAHRLPELTLVLDHMPNAKTPPDPGALKTFHSRIAELGHAPGVYVKLSEVMQKVSLATPGSSSVKDTLDRLWDAFGPDRVLYGSDWPNSDHIAPYAQTFATIRDYVAQKGTEASAKFFFRNSQRAYRWTPRRPDQHFASPPAAPVPPVGARV